MTEAQQYFSTLKPEPVPPSAWSKRWVQKLSRAMRALGYPETAKAMNSPGFR